MPELPEDIFERVIRDFGEARAREVYNHLLASVPDGLPNGTYPRHLRCILYLANGDEQQLEYYIEMCLSDPRDVMLNAEYETVSGSNLSRKRDFNKPFSDASLR